MIEHCFSKRAQVFWGRRSGRDNPREHPVIGPSMTETERVYAACWDAMAEAMVARHKRKDLARKVAQGMEPYRSATFNVRDDARVDLMRLGGAWVQAWVHVPKNLLDKAARIRGL